GSISGTVLVEACRKIENGRHSGRIRVDLGHGLLGNLYFRDGQLVNALMGKLEAEPAARAVLGLSRGGYAFEVCGPGQGQPGGPLRLKASDLATAVIDAKRTGLEKSQDPEPWFTDRVPESSTPTRRMAAAHPLRETNPRRTAS